ncbi:isoprenyl transferase [Candidatus Poribacteria bacterium]|nr:isoprenyl transferase [Candidatus Poribacteria bacterium]
MSISSENATEQDLMSCIVKENLPRHVAITMDGNGRWATRRDLPRTEGHKAGVKSVKSAVELCGELEIMVLTLYAFSSENWKRPALEVNALMNLLLEQLKEETPELNEKNIQLKAIGDLSKLPGKVTRELNRSMKITRNNTGLILNLALSYGGRQEIVRVTQSIANDVNNGKIKIKDINEKLFSKYLYTAGLPDPDLIIRTSGEMRISNFLLWQLAYSEIYVTDTLWPDFSKKEFLLALLSYQKRNRRFGGV